MSEGDAVEWWPPGELGQSYRSQQGLTAADHLEWGYPSAEELLCMKKHVRCANQRFATWAYHTSLLMTCADDA